MTARAQKLPDFVKPMLARMGSPFDSDDYVFEVKWDGTRCLAFIEESSYRLVNRRRIDMTERYPEFAFLSQIQPGAILDGEVVVLKDGKPDFPSLMSREQARSPRKIPGLCKLLPAMFVAFDLLYERYESIMDLPLRERRERLQKLIHQIGHPQFVFSVGVVGAGKALFQEVAARDIEGVMAKRLESRYLPGERTDAWIKIKRGETVCCLIFGFLPDGKDFRSLILAAETDGKLQYVGKVGTGFNAATRKKINDLIWARLRPKPIIPCKEKGKWLEPGLYCMVHCMERTENGILRAPAFKGLVEA